MYKTCCAGDLFAVFGNDYRGNPIIYNKSKNDKDYNTLMNYCQKSIEEPSKQVKSLDAANASKILLQLYIYLKKFLEPFTKASSCQRGCSGCCNILVETTMLEAKLVINYFHSNYTKNDLNHVIDIINIQSDKYPTTKELYDTTGYEQMRENYNSLKLKCPFLNKHGECMVYAVRPYYCIKHLVFGDPQKCSTNEITLLYNNPSLKYVLECIQMLSGLSCGTGIFKHLPDWFNKKRYT
jgi:Fe-S-cluster containining protein